MNTFSFDLVVVGAGSGGYAAARTAAALGANVALVDHGPLGGLCILRGCMPSKTLLASSEAAHDVRAAAALGVHAGDPRIDLPAILERKDRIIGGFAQYRVEQIERFPLYEGRARFLAPNRLAVGDDTTLESSAFIVATGSVIAPAVMPGLVETGFIDSDAALTAARIPKSLAVLGGGYVASELGQYFSRLGAAVTVLIRSDQLLTSEDADVGSTLTAAFRAEGIDVRTGVTLERAERRGANKVVAYSQGGVRRELEVEEIFFALGRVPNVAGLDLERAGVAYHAISGIAVADDLRTNVPTIFAVGDVTGQFPLVHVAIYQGEVAARNAIGGGSERADYRLQNAHAVFTDPQVAVVGLTEKQLAAAGIEFRKASYPFDDHGKAIAIGRTAGFVKMIADPIDGRILGAAVVGAHASDLIHEVIVAMNYSATVFDFVKIPHLHPTMAEIWTYPAEELAEQLAEELAGRRIPATA